MDRVRVAVPLCKPVAAQVQADEASILRLVQYIVGPKAVVPKAMAVAKNSVRRLRAMTIVVRKLVVVPKAEAQWVRRRAMVNAVPKPAVAAHRREARKRIAVRKDVAPMVADLKVVRRPVMVNGAMANGAVRKRVVVPGPVAPGVRHAVKVPVVAKVAAGLRRRGMKM